MSILYGIRVASALVLFCSLMPAALAISYARQLPPAPESQMASFKYELHKHVIEGNPVTLIDVLTGMGDWIRPEPTHLRRDRARLVPSLQGQFQRFYGEMVGWMLVPSGWHLQFATMGADGNSSYTFVSPQGVASGWLDYSVTPACVSCILGQADGLLPEAWAQEVAMGYVHGARPWRPVPTPEQFDHPDNCTALLRYRSGGLTVSAAILSNTPMIEAGGGNTSLAEVYVALPTSKAALAQAIVNGLQRAYPTCQGGWSLPD